MLDLTNEQGRIISAALGLATEKPWAQVALADIAERAGATLVDMRRHYQSKGEILAAFSHLVDDEMLRRAPRKGENLQPRDALFEVIMSRFDVLEPYKSALKSIASSGLPELAQFAPLFATQGWMLEAAGIDLGGLGGQARAAGLATVYASVFRTWLEDEDQGHSRTMAALDRRLRRGQRTLERVDDVCSGIERVASSLTAVVRDGLGRRAGAKTPADATSPEPHPQPPKV